MVDINGLTIELLKLEEQIMLYDPEMLDKLLCEDFREHGSSGRVYSKQDQLDAARDIQIPNIEHEVFDFIVKQLAEDIALVTYRTLRKHDQQLALRSSIWTRSELGWQMLFHQGTPQPLQNDD